jgi:hypothetical protein
LDGLAAIDEREEVRLPAGERGAMSIGETDTWGDDQLVTVAPNREAAGFEVEQEEPRLDRER